MIYVLVMVIVLGAVALAMSGVVAFFNSGASSARKEVKAVKSDLADSNERVSIAQTALMEIASGDTMPVLRASDALAQITKSYTQGY